MEPLLAVHNTHLEGREALLERDPQLRALRRQRLVHESRLLAALPRRVPGIYTLGGARQIGKTTLIKQWIAHLLDEGVAPQRIVYLTGELIDDHHRLVRLLGQQLETMPGDGLLFILLDEVTYISAWERGIKFAADSGILERVILVLTGSDLSMVREARTQLPGRRGRAAEVDLHLYPLSYAEVAGLTGGLGNEELQALGSGEEPAIADLNDDAWDRAYAALRHYLVHGGFLTAINDMAADGRILPATLATYSDWIRGDMLRRGKQERYLREVLFAISTRLGSQVTWNALSRELSIDHPKTVADYVELLSAMDALFIQPALLESRLAAAPKKARKVLPCDPFILHAVRAWLEPVSDPHSDLILPVVDDPERASGLVEACLVTHARRHFPTYYLKAEGEVDLAIVSARRFWPIEVKWRAAIRHKDLKQVAKYPNGVIAAPVHARRTLQGVPMLPLPVLLCCLGEGRWPVPAAGRES